jgi:hypothetical protein
VNQGSPSLLLEAIRSFSLGGAAQLWAAEAPACSVHSRPNCKLARCILRDSCIHISHQGQLPPRHTESMSFSTTTKVEYPDGTVQTTETVGSARSKWAPWHDDNIILLTDSAPAPYH